MAKQRAESIDIYKKNNRSDLLEVEQNEYDVFFQVFSLNNLVMKKLKIYVKKLYLKLNASSLKDMGKVMGELKKKYGDEIDFAKAGGFIKTIIK